MSINNQQQMYGLQEAMISFDAPFFDIKKETIETVSDIQNYLYIKRHKTIEEAMLGGSVYLEKDEWPCTAEQIYNKMLEIESSRPLKLLRQHRNMLLSETDWWVLPDRTPTQAQLDYRQALRDITDTYSSLDDVVWPKKPTE